MQFLQQAGTDGLGYHISINYGCIHGKNFTSSWKSCKPRHPKAVRYRDDCQQSIAQHQRSTILASRTIASKTFPSVKGIFSQIHKTTGRFFNGFFLKKYLFSSTGQIVALAFAEKVGEKTSKRERRKEHSHKRIA